MAKSTKFLVTALCVVSITTIPIKAVAQDTNERRVEQYTCKDVMREGGTSRDTAVAFLHGFVLGKSGGSDFDLEALTKQTDAFIDHCLDNPADKAIDAMTKVKS